MEDLRQELAALRRRLRSVVVIAALAAVTVGMGGAALAVAFRAETLDVWTVSTNDAGGSPQTRLSASGDLATTRVQVKNATLELAAQTSAVASPNAGALWYDSNTSQKRLKFYNGTAWVDSAEFAVCEGRLTLTTGAAVPASDQTAKTTVYFTAYNGNRIGLYTGSAWNIYTFTSDVSLALTSWTASKNNDVFMYDSSGTLTLERVEWTNDTTRATALVLQDGIYVKSGATTRRYLGTIRTTGTTGQCEDSNTNRFVANYYNRVARQGLICPGRNDNNAATTYSTASTTFVQANGGTGSKFAYLTLGEDSIAYSVSAYFYGTTVSTPKVGVGEDSTSSATICGGDTIAASNYQASASASRMCSPSAGYHYLELLICTDAGTTVYYADYPRYGSSADPYATSLTVWLRM